MAIDSQTKIMHVVHSLSGGGTERSMVALLSGMHLPYVNQQVVTLRQAGDLSAALPNHISCRALGKKRTSRTAFFSLARLSRDFRTLIHARNTCCWADATLAAMLNPDIKLVLGFHGLETQGVLPLRYRWVARIAHHLGGRFVSVSEAGKTLIHQQAGIPLERIEVIYTGIDRNKFSVISRDERDKSRLQLGIANDSIVVGCVGSLTPIKNHDALLRSFARFLQTYGQHATLLLVGDGPCGSSLHNLAMHLGIESHVIWLGQSDEVALQLSAMDVYVCSSHSEGISNAMLEAMACGLPIVSTNVGDHGLVVRDGIDGLVLHEASVDTLSMALIKLAESRGLRAAMGASSREQSAGYNMGRMVTKYESLYLRSLFPEGVAMGTKSSQQLKIHRGPCALAEERKIRAYTGTSGNDE